MTYQPIVNIWDKDLDTTTLTPGQWVYAGKDDSQNQRGRYLGTKKNGVVVVAWQGNAKGRKDYFDYIRTLRNYATAN